MTEHNVDAYKSKGAKPFIVFIEDEMITVREDREQPLVVTLSKEDWRTVFQALQRDIGDDRERC